MNHVVQTEVLPGQPPGVKLSLTDEAGHPKLTIWLEPLHWDSRLLGVKAYGLRMVKLEAMLETAAVREAGPALRQALQAAHLDFVSCRVPVVDLPLVQELERLGFYTVDTLVTFRKALTSDDANRAAICSVREAGTQDLPSVMKLHSSFTLGRFQSDPRIPESVSARIYEEWIANSVSGRRADLVFIHEDEQGNLSGFISCILSKDSGGIYGVIDLIAVSPEARGRGVGVQLLQRALSYFHSRQAAYVSVGTQGGNQAAIALYQKMGFQLKSLDISLHYWK